MGDEKIIGNVLNSFINTYNHFEKPISKEEGIYEMNGGWCGIVASIVGYILITKYKIKNLKICNNALHIYLSYKGKGYDTLYPEGYPIDVEKHWLLKEIGESTFSSCSPAGDEVNKGYYDWGFVYIFKSLCERYDIPLPPYFSQYEKGAEEMTTNSSILARKKRMELLFKSSFSVPLSTGSVEINKVLPFTHYERGEREESTNRPLKVIDFKQMKNISEKIK